MSDNLGNIQPIDANGVSQSLGALNLFRPGGLPIGIANGINAPRPSPSVNLLRRRETGLQWADGRNRN